MKKYVMIGCVVVFFALAGIGCEKEGSAEKVGKDIDKFLKKTGEKIEKTVENVQEDVKKATE